MARILYKPRNFTPESLTIIRLANEVCAAYAEEGYDLTLRQLYYQFVARDWLPNTERSYKRLGSIINDARLAGLLDWDYIVDRTRNLEKNPHWRTPRELIASAAKWYRKDRWAEQSTYVEVWIEKDALVGVLQSCCPDEDVPYFSCRGYTSQSELWDAGQRLTKRLLDHKQNVVVIHLGDHDPSGIDMTRDIMERVGLFIACDTARVAIDMGYDKTGARKFSEQMWSKFKVQRIALTMAQIEEHEPPPNPAKLTDSRSGDYVERYGYSSWELDALEPATLVGLIRDAVEEHRDPDLWERKTQEEEDERRIVNAASELWGEVDEWVREQIGT